jgi:HEAT repeat protein
VDVAGLRVVPGGAGPGAEVTLEIVLTPVQGGGEAPRREMGSAAVPLVSAPTPRDAWRRALAAAAQRSAEGLAIGLRAESKRIDGLVADLGSKDLRVREHAVRVLGERRAREAVPALLAELKQEDSRLAHRVVAALAQIGDPQAVPALIDLSQSTDATLSLRLVRYIGDIGGGEAEGYLLTLASGHPDPRMRRAAREALDELEARAKEAALAAARK